MLANNLNRTEQSNNMQYLVGNIIYVLEIVKITFSDIIAMVFSAYNICN